MPECTLKSLRDRIARFRQPAGELAAGRWSASPTVHEFGMDREANFSPIATLLQRQTTL